MIVWLLAKLYNYWFVLVFGAMGFDTLLTFLFGDPISGGVKICMTIGTLGLYLWFRGYIGSDTPGIAGSQGVRALPLRSYTLQFVALRRTEDGSWVFQDLHSHQALAMEDGDVFTLAVPTVPKDVEEV